MTPYMDCSWIARVSCGRRRMTGLTGLTRQAAAFKPSDLRAALLTGYGPSPRIARARYGWPAGMADCSGSRLAQARFGRIEARIVRDSAAIRWPLYWWTGMTRSGPERKTGWIILTGERARSIFIPTAM